MGVHGRRGANGPGLGAEDQARGGGGRRTCRGPREIREDRTTLGGAEDTQRGKDAGSSRAWAPAVEERVRRTRVPRHRRVSVLGGTLAARGSVSQFQNPESEKEGGKGGYQLDEISVAYWKLRTEDEVALRRNKVLGGL